MHKGLIIVKTYLLQNKEIIWNTSRAFPPVRACLFSNGLTGITFLGDPSAGTGLPRGTMVYANMPIPFQVSIVLQIRESNYVSTKTYIVGTQKYFIL